MNMRAPLARVRGHGSAKSGAHHWWAQRLSAIALVPLFLWFVASLTVIATADYATAAKWVGSPYNSALLILLIGALFYHAQLGMQVVFEDYISTPWLQVASIILVRFLALLLAVVAIVAVLRIAWGG
ncbi:succinate dehydrogenase, hydrophobic membrane anchor protein [Candidatus Thiosymbion oneisti]|uniref:succinate dehydrogenase, hydrophobic membrane anchor protein n=1 Tax=Candidatus Thiosymbion oneisti TaxID=589554 RepID=UPI000B7DB30B|nr:succinate dehydrogenase, hydrophobic membrane anchor protein [Candidatus Thiosymbion oneisti]